MRIMITVALVLFPMTFGLGCDALLKRLKDNPTVVADLVPTVDVSALELRRSPDLEDLASYYCPKVVSDRLVALGCAVVLGPPPPPSRLAFDFGINLRVHNPNDFPIPALNLLVGLNLYPDDQDSAALGAICVAMCGEDDPNCNTTPEPGACDTQQNDINSLDDLVGRIPGLIADTLSGQAQNELRKSTIVAGGDINLDLVFSLGIDQALKVFEKTAFTYVDDLLGRRTAKMSIPVSIDGTVFFKLPSLGRVGVGYGPLSTVWEVL